MPLPDDAAEELFSLQVRIDSVLPVRDDLDNMCIPDTTIDVLAARLPPTELVGSAVNVELELLGSTQGVRWWLHRIDTIDDPPTDRTGGTT